MARISDADYEVLKTKLLKDLQGEISVWAIKRIGGILLLIAAAFCHRVVNWFTGG